MTNNEYIYIINDLLKKIDNESTFNFIIFFLKKALRDVSEREGD